VRFLGVGVGLLPVALISDKKEYLAVSSIPIWSVLPGVFWYTLGKFPHCSRRGGSVVEGVSLEPPRVR